MAMLSSLLGIRLFLWMGQTVPLPAPYEVVRAIDRVEVTNDADSGDGFQITFNIGKDKTLDFDLLRSGALDPFNRVIIGVLLGATPEVLIDGIITHHQVTPSNEPGMSTLTVTGQDLSLMLDLEEKNGKYENQPDFLIVNRIILSYGQYGLVPQATPTADVPIMLQRIPRQHDTDLQFIQRMAKRNGFIFYIEPLAPAVNTAYWGPENRLSIPQPALTVDMGDATNVTSLHFANDATAPTGVEGSFVEPFTKMSIPIPPLPPLKIPPLAGNIAPAKRTVLARETANQNPIQAALSALARATNTPDAVTGNGEVDTIRYGSVLRARRLVGVRGAGRSYDGNYYVRSVTHTLSHGDYKQSFRISREGTGALLPVVLP